jgi:hypothetical protein
VKINKVNFAPGCFDDFEGTQEELDALKKSIEEKLTNTNSEELEQESVPLEDIWEELDEDTRRDIYERLNAMLEGKEVKRNLN